MHVHIYASAIYYTVSIKYSFSISFAKFQKINRVSNKRQLTIIRYSQNIKFFMFFFFLKFYKMSLVQLRLFKKSFKI